jgi:hypothetical protein
LGWDEFELASMESDMIIEQARMDTQFLGKWHRARSAKVWNKF